MVFTPPPPLDVSPTRGPPSHARTSSKIRPLAILFAVGLWEGVHSTTTWSKGLGVPPAIKVEGDMCGGLNGIYMYSDLWEPYSNLFNGKATSAPMYMREALLCSDGDAYHGLKCGKDNEGRCFFLCLLKNTAKFASRTCACGAWRCRPYIWYNSLTKSSCI